MNRLLLVFVLIASHFSAFADDVKGFDEICTLFSESQDIKGSVGEIWYIVGQKVEKNVREYKAIEVYGASSLSDPSERYKLFKESAELAIGRDWECKPMKQMLETALKNYGTTLD